MSRAKCNTSPVAAPARTARCRRLAAAALANTTTVAFHVGPPTRALATEGVQVPVLVAAVSLAVGDGRGAPEGGTACRVLVAPQDGAYFGGDRIHGVAGAGEGDPGTAVTAPSTGPLCRRSSCGMPDGPNQPPHSRSSHTGTRADGDDPEDACIFGGCPSRATHAPCRSAATA